MGKTVSVYVFSTVEALPEFVIILMLSLASADQEIWCCCVFHGKEVVGEVVNIPPPPTMGPDHLQNQDTEPYLERAEFSLLFHTPFFQLHFNNIS
jgi:hypothetical protein